MSIVFIEALDKTPYEQAVWEILCECDQEFLPSLSSRESSSQKILGGLEAPKTLLPYRYFEVMKTQNYIITLDESCDVTGFMTFIHKYACEELADIGISNYITTICVKKSHRNQGLLKQMYGYIEKDLPNSYKLPYVSTRTWSTNTHHLAALHSLGFTEAYKLKNHRGEGIDTIYFSKKIR